MAGFTPLTITSDQLRIAVLPYGASLVGVRQAGQDRNLVLGFADPSDHARLPVYAGAVVGPIANRISGGTLSLDGTHYRMPQNDAGQNTLHSGPGGLHARIWQVRTHAADRLTLAISLDDGACGLPGRRRITADYHVANDCLTLSLHAVTDATTAINLAPHAYWNLDGRGDVSEHTLQIKADHYLPTDARNLPSGTISPVAGTPFDFRTPRPVPCDPALDINFCLSDHPTQTPRQIATLTGATGTQLAIATDAPGLQVYNGAFLPDTPDVLPDHRALHPYHAIALEPQFWPDAPGHANFPQITLHPDQTFRQITRYRITSAR